MVTLDAKAAAEQIHKAVNIALANDHPSPEERHSLAFVTEVCNHLGLEPTPHNCTLVAGELVKAGIAPHLAQEYPKVIGQRKKVNGKGEPILDEHGRVVMEDVVVNSEDEEKAAAASVAA